jgi:hypothetical protein
MSGMNFNLSHENILRDHHVLTYTYIATNLCEIIRTTQQ